MKDTINYGVYQDGEGVWTFVYEGLKHPFPRGLQLRLDIDTLNIEMRDLQTGENNED